MARSITVTLELDDRNFNRGLSRSQSQVSSLSNTVGGLGRTLAGLAATAAAGFSIKGIVETTARFQDLQTTLNTVTGSVEEGAKAFDFIQQFATQSQFGVEELTEAYIKLKSNGIEPTQQLLTTFTDAAAVTTDQLGSLQAITDLFARTTSGGLGLEELNRLADRGIPVFKMLEEQLGLTRLEISEYGKTAEGARDITDALRVAINKEFGGATQDRLQNLSTSLSNMQIAATNAAATIGEGLAPALQGIVTSFTEFINKNQEALKAVGELIGEGLQLLVDNLDLVMAGVAGFAAAWAAVKIANIITMITNLGRAMLTLNTVIAANPIGALATVIGLAVAGMVSLVQETGSVGNAFKTIGNTAIDVVNMIFNAFSALGTGIKTIFAEIGSIVWDALTGNLDADELGSRFSEALNQAKEQAQAKFISDGPITYEFELEAINDKAALDTKAKLADLQDEINQSARQSANQSAAANQELIETEQRLSEKKTEIHERQMEEAEEKREKEEAAETRRQEHHAREMARAEGILEQAKAKLEADMADINATTEKIGLSDVQIKQLEVTNELNAERDALLAKLATYNISDEERNAIKEQLIALYDEELARQLEAITQTEEQQTRWITGWENALAKYRDDANNTAAQVESTFNTLTSGLEDAFVQFAMTGKLSFKDLIDTMIREIVKFMAKQAVKAFLDILTGGGGSLLSIFGFDKGGYIPAGSAGIVGEKGPEIVQGPARVLSRVETAAAMRDAMVDRPGDGGGRSMVVNINAVDAASFRQLVASDPEFIYSVGLAGGRRLPG